MVPLIDIVFLLLVFFIYAMLSMAVHKGMKVELPESAGPEFSKETPWSVTVQVRDDVALFYLNREQVTLDELGDRLRVETDAARRDREVLLFADKAVSYQQLYTVLDRISSAGITAISLQAEKKR